MKQEEEKEQAISSALPIVFKLEDLEFEGPLDLMLHLISKHKLNIYDIEIFSLVEQYMAFIKTYKKNNMELAGEFIEMASRLVYIKSVMLLPRHEEEKEILKKELEGQLIEYSLCKKVAKILSSLDISDKVFSFKGEELPPDLSYHVIHDSISLLESYLTMSTRDKKLTELKQRAFAPLVTARVVSVHSRAVYLLNRLYRSKIVSRDDCFFSCQDRSELVATFLAVLNLIKTKRIQITPDYTIKKGFNETALSGEEDLDGEFAYE